MSFLNITHIRNSKYNLIAFVFSGVLLINSSIAFSQLCEPGLEGGNAANVQLPLISTALDGVESSVPAALEARNLTLKQTMEMELARLQFAYVDNIKDLGTSVIEDGLKPLVAQIVSAKLVAQVQNVKAEDSKNMQRDDERRQDQQLEAIKTYKPSPQDYKFDSKGIYLKIGEKFRRTSSSFLTKLFSDIGNNKEGYSNKGGPVDMANNRWNTYLNFCDPNAGTSNNGCDNPDGSDMNRVNIHVMPSKAIFTDYTFDFEGEDYLMKGLKELAFNISGFQNGTSLMKDVLGGVRGREKLVEARRYLAQMDAANAMMYSVMAERFPIPEDTHATGGNPIQKLRTSLGAIEASAKPSFYESKQSFIEELRSPEYYLDLIDNKNTIDRKEIYLRAYGLMILNEIIDKQEKISNAYAIETANMLISKNNLQNNAMSSASSSSPE